MPGEGATQRSRSARAGDRLADGAVATATPGVISFTHTEIDSARSGEGLGTVLVQTALDAARAEGLAVQPYSPFVQNFIRRHREYLDLVPAARRANFALEEG